MTFTEKIFVALALLLHGNNHVAARKYRKSTSECRFKNNIYKSTKVRSRIECSSLCSQELCSRFIYDSSCNMCDLHSDDIHSNATEETPVGRSLYLSTHKDCIVPGYDFVESLNFCFKWFGGSYTWWEGRALCQQDGGDLLTLDKMGKWNFIYQHLYTCPYKRIWLGLIDKTWNNGVPFQDVYNVTTSFDNPSYDQSCVRLRVNAQFYVLMDMDCTVGLNVICEIHLDK